MPSPGPIPPPFPALVVSLVALGVPLAGVGVAALRLRQHAVDDHRSTALAAEA